MCPMFYSTCPAEEEGKRMENNLAYFELLLFMYRLVYGKELDEKTSTFFSTTKENCCQG